MYIQRSQRTTGSGETCRLWHQEACTRAVAWRRIPVGYLGYQQRSVPSLVLARYMLRPAWHGMAWLASLRGEGIDATGRDAWVQVREPRERLCCFGPRCLSASRRKLMHVFARTPCTRTAASWGMQASKKRRAVDVWTLGEALD